MRKSRRILSFDSLESRALAAPTIFTFSFVPDETPLGFGDGRSTMQRRLNRSIGRGLWQRQIDRAFQTWANTANVEFVQVRDSGLPLGTVGLPHGDPRFGDIRIHGTVYADKSFVAETFDFGGAGIDPRATFGEDIALNFSYSFSARGIYGLQSVLTHEIGHVLGLPHNNDPNSVMNPYSQGIINPDFNDIRDVRAIYPGQPSHTVVTISPSSH